VKIVKKSLIVKKSWLLKGKKVEERFEERFKEEVCVDGLERG